MTERPKGRRVRRPVPPSRFPERVLLRLPAGTLDRMDRVIPRTESRLAWIRHTLLNGLLAAEMDLDVPAGTPGSPEYMDAVRRSHGDRPAEKNPAESGSE